MTAGKRFDLTLYLVTDRRQSGGRPLEEIVRAAIAGGVTTVQLREKDISTREYVALARTLREITGEAGVTFIVNDRVDVALAADADGVHVGQEDMPAALARGLIGPDRILGVTAASEAEARRAQGDGADYVGCNAVFATPSKTDTGPPLGLEGLRRLAQAVSIPVVAIGGINAGNAAEVMACGVAGIAVVSALMSAPDVTAAARQLRTIAGDARAGATPAGVAPSPGVAAHRGCRRYPGPE
ncbi:MAG: thiamine phosphate synthase [Bacillota bacterium]|nr:thiamine phosphate synthase [Bacillota bacterium]